MSSRTRIFAILASILMLTVPYLAFAANAFVMPSPPGNLPNKALDVMILDMVNWLLGFVIILAILVIVYGGVYYITSVGEMDRVETAKNIITYGVMGLVVAGLSYAIVAAVVKLIGAG